MRDDMKAKTIVQVVLATFAVLILLFLIWPTFGIDLIAGMTSGDFYWFKGDVRQIERRGEKLPAVSVEGDMVYCRMYACDFHFPLPDNVRVVRTNIDEGGFDTINGAIYVVGPDGGPVDMRTYAERLQKKRYSAAPCDGSGCPDVTNSRPDVPFISGTNVIHYPLFDDFWASSPDEEGGSIEVKTENNTTKIRFSYFGDY